MSRNPVQYYGTGRRKTSVARVFLSPGSGVITVNGRALDSYFVRQTLRTDLVRPLAKVGQEAQLDATITVKGGGKAGQAGAVRLGIARALLSVNPEYRAALKPEGFLTRDPRKVERKKYGRAGARRRFQFSKR